MPRLPPQPKPNVTLGANVYAAWRTLHDANRGYVNLKQLRKKMREDHGVSDEETLNVVRYFAHRGYIIRVGNRMNPQLAHGNGTIPDEYRRRPIFGEDEK